MTEQRIIQGINGAGTPYLVKAVSPEEDYVLLVTFEDGVRKRVDVKPLIRRGGVFDKLNDEAYFRRAHVERDTVAWDDVIDIAPESLYERGVLA